MSRRLVASLLLAAVAVAWGAIPLIVREDVPVSQLVAMRVWFGALALIVIGVATQRLQVPAAHWWRLVVAGVALTLHWVTFFAAIKTTTVAVSLAVVYLGPISAALIAPRLLGERAGRQVFAGLGIGFIGVLLVVRPGGEGVTAAGVGWALVSAVLFAILMLVSKPAAEELGGLTVATVELSVAAVLMVPWAVAGLRESSEFLPEFLLLGVVLTGLGWTIYWGAMGLLPVAAVGVLVYLEPASAAVWAFAVLGEQPGLAGWIGIVLVIVGGILAVTNVSQDEPYIAPATF